MKQNKQIPPMQRSALINVSRVVIVKGPRSMDYVYLHIRPEEKTKASIQFCTCVEHAELFVKNDLKISDDLVDVIRL